jgi:hypothetical protein
MTTPFPFVAETVLTASQLNAITTLPISAKTASATLVIGDVGYRVQMTSASATTITVDTGIFSAGDTIWIQNIGAGTCTITSGTCTVSTASSLALAQYGGGTLVFQSASAATFFSGGGANYGVATGGTSSPITVSGVDYTLLTFTSDTNLVVSKAGIFDVLMFGGGAGGMYNGASYCGAGGGAGGILTTTVYLIAGTYTVDIGAGGAYADYGNFTTGYPTTLGTIAGGLTAVGGLGLTTNNGYTAGNIGCGQGSTIQSTNAFNNIDNVQGYKGGLAAYYFGSGGGGGTGSAGGAGVSTTGGDGGNGTDVSFFIGGSTLYKGSGGGGGGTVTGGAAGSGLGNAGGGNAAGQTPAANTASGGGGAAKGAPNLPGTGSSGIMYVRFK